MNRIFLSGVLWAFPVIAQQVPVALAGATVVVGNGQVLPQATVVMQNGRIEAVGADVAVPPGATVIDARGLRIYPGLIDALTEEGFRGPAKPPGGPMFAGTL